MEMKKQFNVLVDMKLFEIFKLACEREGYKKKIAISKMMYAFVKEYHPDLLDHLR